jgi:hypothetical protein
VLGGCAKRFGDAAQCLVRLVLFLPLYASQQQLVLFRQQRRGLGTRRCAPFQHARGEQQQSVGATLIPGRPETRQPRKR